jgi:hypothetical protein
LERIKNVLAHQVYGGDMNKILHIMADTTLEKYDPEVRARKAAARKARKEANERKASESKASASQPSSNDAQVPWAPKVRTRHIPRDSEYQIADFRALGCAYVDPRTGKRCGEMHGLQKDHFDEFFLGGSHKAENLQWLCGPHNRYKHSKITEEMRQAGFAVL